MNQQQIQTIVITVLISTLVAYFLTRWMDKQFMKEHTQSFHNKP